MTNEILIDQSAAKTHRPDWRWTACRYGVVGPDYDCDLTLQAMRAFYADLTNHGIDEQTLIRTHSDLAVAYVCFCHDHRYGLRWLLEMWILAGFSNSQIKAKLKNLVPASSIQLFRLMFFDIEEHRSDKAYMSRHVLQRSKSRSDACMDLIECDFIWKQFADDLIFLKATSGLTGHISNAVRGWQKYPLEVKLSLFRMGTELSNGVL